MIYVIHSDYNYLSVTINPDEIINKHGRRYPFHIQRKLIVYSDVWPDSLSIELVADEKYTKNSVPDVAEMNGRLFLGLKAYDELKGLLKDFGEILPVNFKQGIGYIFNPLITAEPFQGVDEKLTTHDKYGNLENFSFIEIVMRGALLFRTELDTYISIFCNEAFKVICESTGLVGRFFSEDVPNPIAEPYGVID